MKGRLEIAGAAQGEPFVEVLPGTREERVGRGVGVIQIETGPLRTVTQLRRRLRRLDDELHHGQITWWIRVASWLLLAVPAWFASPWLALPAVLVAEVVHP